MEPPARWALVKRGCPPPFRQTLSPRGLRQAAPTWSFIAAHEHSSLARLAALAKHEDSSPPRSMRARADHGGAIVSAAILKYSSPLLLIHPFLLASLAWQSLHSDGQRQIPTPWLLLARQFSACPQTHNFKDMFRKLVWSLAPFDIRNPKFPFWNSLHLLFHIVVHFRFMFCEYAPHLVNILPATDSPPRSPDPPIPQD